MRKRSQRLWLFGAAAALAGGAIALAATGLKDTVAYFYAPTELVEKGIVREGLSARIGGLVETGSVIRGEDVQFNITDNRHSTPVVFSGLLPDLFGEGQGIVAEGKFDAEGRLVAKRVLAKHDETYMPKEVYDALKAKADDGAAPVTGRHPESVPVGAPRT